MANAGGRVNIVSQARVIIKQGDPGDEDTGQMFNLIENSLMAKGLQGAIWLPLTNATCKDCAKSKDYCSLGLLSF